MQRCRTDDDPVNFDLLHEAGCTCDDTELPHHVSSQEEITLLVDATQEFLSHIKRPTIITMARYVINNRFMCIFMLSPFFASYISVLPVINLKSHNFIFPKSPHIQVCLREKPLPLGMRLKIGQDSIFFKNIIAWGITEEYFYI